MLLAAALGTAACGSGVEEERLAKDTNPPPPPVIKAATSIPVPGSLPAYSFGSTYDRVVLDSGIECARLERAVLRLTGEDENYSCDDGSLLFVSGLGFYKLPREAEKTWAACKRASGIYDESPPSDQARKRVAACDADAGNHLQSVGISPVRVSPPLFR